MDLTTRYLSNADIFLFKRVNFYGEFLFANLSELPQLSNSVITPAKYLNLKSFIFIFIQCNSNSMIGSTLNS